MRLCTQIIQNDEVIYSNSYKMYEVVYIKLIQNDIGWCTSISYKMYEFDVLITLSKCMRSMYINLIQNVWGYVLHNCTKWWGYIVQTVQNDEAIYSNYTKWWDWCTSTSYKMYEVDVHQTHTKCMSLMYS